MIMNSKIFARDLKSGITVFLVAIPLCLGIALASGAPVLSGLIAGIIGGIIVGLLSGSQLSVSGPAAGLVAIILAASHELGSFNMVLTAIIIAGGLQIILGFLGAGIIAHYIPYSVVKGMLAAIGLILILKQIPHALGYDGVYEGSLSFSQNDGENTITELLTIFNHVSNGAIIISLLCFSLLYLLSRKKIQQLKILKFIPGSLIIIALGALTNLFFHSFYPQLALTGDHLVRLPNLMGEDAFASSFVFPDFAAFSLLSTYKYAFILAVVASIETLLCIEATDKLDPEKRLTPTCRELKAQGVGNILSGLTGGLPITSVIVRSSVNIENNAKTKMSTIIHGLLLVVSIFIARPLINHIPLSALACILIAVGYKLTHEKLIREMFYNGADQFIPFIVTLFAILFTDLLTGVFIGLVVTMFIVLRNYYKVQNFELVPLADSNNSFNLTFNEYLTFLSKANLEKSLYSIPENASMELDFSKTKMIDYEVQEMFEDFKVSAHKKNIQIHIKGNSHPQN